MKKIKEKIKNIPVIGPKIKLIKDIIVGKIKFTTSKNYWEERYKTGGNSGAGSYDRLAKFKAEIINDLIKQEKIETVLEFGCGDGNQLNLFKIKSYVGLDVSETAIRNCIKKFKKDNKKSFFIYDPFCFSDNAKKLSCELTLSLDVLFHLVEYDIFEKYLLDLFSTSKKWVIIYSSNFDSTHVAHEKRRNFTNWVEKNISNFKLIKIINNKYPHIDGDPQTSKADFYIYKKIN